MIQRNTKMKVEEPAVIYGRYESVLYDVSHMVFAAQKGIGASIFDDVVNLYGHLNYMAEVIDLNLKTIQKYKNQNIKFSPARSELMLKLVALYHKGEQVFGVRDAFLNWLAKPAYGIDNRIPFDLIKTSDGITLVDEELDRIQYGDTA